MTIRLRPAVDTADYVALGAVLDAVGIAGDLQQLQRTEQSVAPPAVRRRMLAVTSDGQVVGTSSVRHALWMPAGQLDVTVAVVPARQSRGFGSALYAEALAYAMSWGATALTTTIDDSAPHARRFAEQRGFVLHQHWIYWHLRLVGFEEAPFAAALSEVEARGIRFSSVAEAPPSRATQQKLYALNRRTSLDAPGEDSFPTFDAFVQDIMQAPWFRPDAQILAVDGDAWIGLAAVGLDGPRAFQAFMGVDRAYRRQHIALALTLLSIRYARRHDARVLEVFNDARNTAMITMQTKLGYKRIPGRIIMRLPLAI